MRHKGSTCARVNGLTHGPLRPLISLCTYLCNPYHEIIGEADGNGSKEAVKMVQAKPSKVKKAESGIYAATITILL